jgi:hypothetical protein
MTDILGLVGRLDNVAVSIGMPWDAEHRQDVFDTIKEAKAALEAMHGALRGARLSLATTHEFASIMSDKNWLDIKTDIQRHASYGFDRIDAVLSLTKEAGE